MSSDHNSHTSMVSIDTSNDSMDHECIQTVRPKLNTVTCSSHMFGIQLHAAAFSSTFVGFVGYRVASQVRGGVLLPALISYGWLPPHSSLGASHQFKVDQLCSSRVTIRLEDVGSTAPPAKRARLKVKLLLANC
eukprot:6464997-Amphidinium_carterae.1